MKRYLPPYLMPGYLPVMILLVIALFSINAYGQETQPTGGLKGRIRDTSNNKDCSMAVVAVLSADSTLVTWTRTEKNGNFFIVSLPFGVYILMIDHPAYEDYFCPVTIGGDTTANLGLVVLVPKADTLPTVTVKPSGPLLRIRKDTLEYNAANIRLHANATVEELLKRLPGVQIDQSGVITVNGQRIQRLLLDGEDFFGRDPTITTRNLNADMIAKVQVLDKKSKQAEFTGVNDGSKIKTLNLTLKEEKKNGFFGKAEAGGGNKGYYNTNALLATFHGRRQFAVMAKAANTGETGFTDAIGEEGTGLSLGGDAEDAMGASAGPGIPVIRGVGVHYANRWNGEADHLVTNYAFGHIISNPYSSSITEQKLPDSIYLQKQSSRSTNSMDQHFIVGKYEWVPDTLSAFNLLLGGIKLSGHNQFMDEGQSYFNDTLVNNSARRILSDVQNQLFQGSLMYRRNGKKKKERALSLTTFLSKTDNTTKGFLNAINNFYQKNGNLLRRDTTDQRKNITSSELAFSGNLNYLEPLWKGTVLASSYGLSYDRNNSALEVYNKGDGKYQNYVDSLGNHYDASIFNQTATLNLQFESNRLSYTIGGDLIYNRYRQKDLLKDSLLHYNYFALAPKVNLRYNLKETKMVRFEYAGSTLQPFITDIQPIRNNNDPLHMVIGNPNLHAGFNHKFEMNFENVRPLFYHIGFNYGFSTSSFSSRTYIDSLGRQVSQVVNTDGSREAGLYFNISKNLPKVDLDLRFNTNLSYNRSANYVNALLNITDTYNGGGGFSVNKNVPDKYSFQLTTNFTYFHSRSSINGAALTHFWTQNHTATLGIYPFRNWELNTTFLYNWREKTDVFDTHNTVALWNASLGRNFLSNKLNVRWQINDILNANAGITRTITANQVSENRTNVLGRYWMLSAAYRFMKQKK